MSPEPDNDPVVWEIWARPRLFGVLLGSAVLLVSYFFAGFRLGGNDEGAVLAAAGKILRGGVFYRDIDAYPFPGAHYLLAAAMAVFGEHLSVARALAALVYVAIVLCLYAVALPLLGRARAALFGVALLSFKLLAWPAFTAFFYWDLAFLAAVAAIGSFLPGLGREQPLRLAAVGALVGVAFISKQNVGIYLAGALVGVILYETSVRALPERARRSFARQITPLALGFTLAVAPGLAYFASQGLLAEMIQSGLIRPFTDYAATSGISYLEPLLWWQLTSLEGTAGFSYFPEPYWTLLRRGLLPGGEQAYTFYWLAGEVFLRWVYTAMPLAFGGALVLGLRAPREGRLGEDRRLSYFAVLSFAVVLSAFPRTDFAHMMGIYPLVLLLLFAVVGELWPDGAGRRSARVLRGVEIAAVAALLVVCALQASVLFGSMTARLDLERAKLRVWPDDSFVSSIVRFVEEEVAEDEPLFVYGHEAYYYFLSGRYSPWPFSQLYPGQAGSDQGAALASRLEREMPKVVIQGFVHFPGVPGLPTQVPRLDAFLKQHYEATRLPFQRHPPATRRAPPEHRVQVLRPRRQASQERDAAAGPK